MKLIYNPHVFFQGAQTIKKSYSLSDLTETDGGDDRIMMLQELQLPARHHRIAKPTTKQHSNVITRSSSLNKRPTTEIYTFQELEVKDTGQNDMRYEEFFMSYNTIDPFLLLLVF